MSSMTGKEREIVDMTVGLVNAFAELPDTPEHEIKEFIEAIHRVQDMVLARPTRRELNIEA